MLSPNNWYNALSAMVTLFHLKALTGVFSGAILQYFFGVKKGYRIAFIIALSSLFVAFFILSPMLDHYEITPDSSIRIIVYSLSALISVELISLIIKVLPAHLSKRLLKGLGVDNNAK